MTATLKPRKWLDPLPTRLVHHEGSVAAERDVIALAVVGSTALWANRAACDAICAAIDELNPAVLVSGGAEGVDTLAELIGRHVYRLPVVVYLPEHHRWEPRGFKDRNLLIARYCTHLLRVAAADSKTYGSGWTRDRAAEMGKPTREVVI